MRILKVIHGYPMRYNAGSEVYSQTLCHGLRDLGHEVQVFTRQEDPFLPDYAITQGQDPDRPDIPLHIVNMPRARDGYRHPGVDARFATLLEAYQPDLVHVGHLNHLSTSLLTEAASRQIPILYTLHDYWLMCPRGQFMQMFPKEPEDLWAACEGQQDRKCAERCYARYFSGSPEERELDASYWEGWVRRRMEHVREMAELVDTFIAPARYLMERYHKEFGIPKAKLTYLDYGFDRKRLTERERVGGEPFTFGYIGTHIPAKGIHHLLEAFGALGGSPRLRIWGRPRGQATAALKALAARLPGDAPQRIEWLSEYRNQNIVGDVFNKVDAIVVPSVWVENSPLVIHEAQQARVPVVTADIGGMAEYVQDGHNGLSFKHRDPQSLCQAMQRLVDDPTLAQTLGQRGYLFSESGDVPDVTEHVESMVSLYEGAVKRRDSARLSPRPGPWRITFDTNPDTCNLRCIMCEEHSPHSPNQKLRRAGGREPRLMPIELLERVMAEGARNGLKEVIPSTMGEPLLYHEFDRIIELCHEHGVKLNLTTNGTFPRRGALEWAKRIAPVTSDIKISFNGATPGTQQEIMIGAQWERVLGNIKTFIAVRDRVASEGKNRCRVTLQVTFLAANVEELPDIARLAIELGVDRLKGHHLWAHFDAIKGQSMRRSPAAIDQWNGVVERIKDVVEANPLPNGERLLLENIFTLDSGAEEDLAPGGVCPFLGQEAWISAEGRFDPCCAPDTQRRSLGKFGNLKMQSLMEIWEGDAYQGLVSSYRTRGLCRGCNMRKPGEA